MAENKYFNRQINYFIIKQVWALNYNGKSQLELYKRLNMSRQLYSRIMTCNCNTRLDRQSSYCSELTSIDQKIFTGLKTFELNVNIDWEEFFENIYPNVFSNNRNECSALDRKKVKKAYHEVIKKIEDEIKSIKQQIDSNTSKYNKNIEKLIHYCKYKTKDSFDTNIEKLDNTISSMRYFDIAILEKICNLENSENKTNNLEKYMKALREEYEIVHAVYVYMKHKK